MGEPAPTPSDRVVSRQNGRQLFIGGSCPLRAPSQRPPRSHRTEYGDAKPVTGDALDPLLSKVPIKAFSLSLSLAPGSLSL